MARRHSSSTMTIFTLFRSFRHWLSHSTIKVTKYTKMANTAVKVAVVDGDFASLVGLGFPLLLSLHLQEKSLSLKQIGQLSPPGVGFPLASSGLPLILSLKPSLEENKKKETRPVINLPLLLLLLLESQLIHLSHPLWSIATTPTQINANHHPQSSQQLPVQ